MKFSFNFIRLLPAFVIASMLLAGCGEESENKKVVLTTGFAKNEVFRIEEASCQRAEMMVYLTNIQNHYETVFGSQIWETNIRPFP